MGVCYFNRDDNISEGIVKPDELEIFPQRNLFKNGLNNGLFLYLKIPKVVFQGYGEYLG